jgi:hypothetical protein
MGGHVKINYIECRNCHKSFGLTVGTGKLTLEALPDPFEAECPHCLRKETYAKADLPEAFVKSPR